ncbi:hypothetical protein HY57_00650 [Dyella japonica A8]|uniref:Uncharacterized protein n=1 Tax=Dyella japonica A8 TaxID=1217721 RepID=A0A075JUT2_9GAMM|nr:hypothetical protein HY57_00650 [Dyella japonica A8]
MGLLSHRLIDTVIPAQAGIQFLSWSVVASGLPVIGPLTQRAFRPSAEGRVTFLLLAQKKSNPKKMALRARAGSMSWG